MWRLDYVRTDEGHTQIVFGVVYVSDLRDKVCAIRVLKRC